MNVLLIADAGSTVGFGHLRRCRTIAQAFRDRGHRVTLRQGSGGASLPSFSDIAILDSRRAGRRLWAELRRKCRVLTAIDDNGDVDFPCDWIVNGNIFASSIRYSAGPRTTLLLGLRFHPLASEYRQAGPKEVRPSIRRLLITLGGSSQAGLPGIIRAAAGVFPQAAIDVVAPGPAPGRGWPARVGFHSLQPTLYPLLRQADAVVSGGGQTLYQMAATGTPGVGIELSSDQTRNLAAMAEAGCILSAGPAEARNFPRRLEEALTALGSASLRRRLSEAGRGLVDGMGAQRLAGILENA